MKSADKPRSKEKGKRAVSFEPELPSAREHERIVKPTKKRTPLPDLFEDELEELEASQGKAQPAPSKEEEEDEVDELEEEEQPPKSKSKPKELKAPTPPSDSEYGTDYDEPPAPRSPLKSQIMKPKCTSTFLPLSFHK